MATDLIAIGASPTETEFQEKMKERMRQAFGDLMPDAVLASIVSRGIEEAFFKKQLRPGRGYYNQPEEYPSWLVEFVEKEARNKVAEQVKAWFVANPDRVEQIVKDRLGHGIVAAAIAAVDDLFMDEMKKLREGIAGSLDKLRNGG